MHADKRIELGERHSGLLEASLKGETGRHLYKSGSELSNFLGKRRKERKGKEKIQALRASKVRSLADN